MLAVKFGNRLSRGLGGGDAAGLHDGHPIADRKHVFQPVLREENGSAQLPVQSGDGVQKVSRGDGVQLTGGFVQNQHIRLHGHDGGQIQQLFLPPGKLRHVGVKPVLNAEIAGHFRHPQPHGGRVTAKALQAEGQLVPHLVGDNLAVRVLHDVADALSLFSGADFCQQTVVKANRAGLFPVGGQNGFQLSQQGGFSAAAFAAQGKVFPRLQGEADVGQTGAIRGGGVGKVQVLQFKKCHFSSS